jgi:23S rRNA pseudouridine2605 synthase
LQHYAAKRRDRAHRLSKDFLLTAEQLQHARAAAWRQDSNALLTADDAAAWLREVGLTLFLPRTNQIAAPAPTLVEATMGEANSTPKPAAIADATSLLHRLLASQDVLALNLLGIPGDQPDFLATEDTLPFLFALRGDREWERGARHWCWKSGSCWSAKAP